MKSFTQFLDHKCKKEEEKKNEKTCTFPILLNIVSECKCLNVKNRFKMAIFQIKLLLSKMSQRKRSKPALKYDFQDCMMIVLNCVAYNLSVYGIKYLKSNEIMEYIFLIAEII